VNIALDAVLFADGTAVGPDTQHCIPRWKAWLEAEKQVFTAAVQSSSMERRALLRQLAEPGSAEFRRNSQRDVNHFSDLGVVADHANTYAECLDLARAYVALAILAELDENSASTIDNLRAILASRQFPTVHKKGLGNDVIW
jgi:hypothetical protein